MEDLRQLARLLGEPRFPRWCREDAAHEERLPQWESAEALRCNLAEEDAAKAALRRVTFFLPDMDITDLVGFDPYAYRAMPVKMLTEIMDWNMAPETAEMDQIALVVGLLSHMGLSTTSSKRPQKLWDTLQTNPNLDIDTKSITNKFFKKYLVNSAIPGW